MDADRQSRAKIGTHMADEEQEADGADTELFESRVGNILRDARQGKSVALAQIAKSTRVPLRQLENIENSDYEKLPAPTYATGFVKAYAREVGLDQNVIAAQFREEISYRTANETAGDYFEPTDPARVPPKSLAMIAAAIAIILAVGYGLWRSGVFGDSAEDLQRLAAGADNAEASQEVTAGEGSPTTTAAPATGAVVLQAQETVWFRIYNLETGERIYEAELQAGDTYEVPATAQNPAIRTGRANVIRVTVGGQRVAPLGPAETIVSDVSLVPADLAARRPQRSSSR